MDKKIPLWAPAAAFVVLGLILFRGFVASDAMLVGNDTLSLGYVARAFYAEALNEMGTFPLWAPHILGGTPFLEALSAGDSLYPPSLLLLLLMEPYRALGWKLVIHIMAAGFFMFGWTRRLGVSRAGATVAGIGYMLAPFLVSLVHPGHDGKIFVTALAPLLFWAVERFFRRGGLVGFAAIGLVVALVISTTHFQMAWFLFMAVGAYALYRAYQVGRERRVAPAATRFGLFLAASVLGAAGAGVQLIPAADYVTEYSRRVQTTRAAAGETGIAWSSSWSMHPEEAMSLVIPEFAGNNANGSDWTTGTYWGRNFFKDNHEYAGLVILLLATLAFVPGARAGPRWFLLGMAGVAFLFAQGTHTPVWRIFYEVVPGIRLFRAPSQAMFLFGFSAATLAAFGVDRILAAVRDGGDEAWRPVLRVLGGGFAFVALLGMLASSGGLASFWTTVVYPDVEPGKLQALEQLRPMLARGGFVALLLAAAAFGAVWAGRRGVLPAWGLVAALALLVAGDELRVDAPFVQTMDFEEWAQPDPNIQALLDREAGGREPYRLFSMARAGQDVKPALYGIDLAAGHHPNDLSRYRELIGMVGSSFPENLLNPNVRQLLNVRYILWPDAEVGPAPEGAAVISRTQYASGQAHQTLMADIGLPRARLVGDAVVRSDDEAVDYILSGAHEPTAEAVLSEAPPTPLGGGVPEGSVAWVERTPNRLRLAVTSDRPALLVLSENWFPAWQVTVDGAEAPVLRAYHTLRAVPVPAGQGMEVEMWYHSTLLVRSAWLSAIVLTGLLLTGGLGLWRARAAAPEPGEES